MYRKVFFCSLCFLFLVLDSQGRTKIELDQDISEKLNDIIKLSVELHQVLVSSDRQKIESLVNALKKSTELAQSINPSAEAHRISCKKILEHFAKQIEMYLNSNKSDLKAVALKEMFRVLVEIVKTYKLEKVQIFYSKKDKIVWIQNSWVPKHPFNSNISSSSIVRVQ